MNAKEVLTPFEDYQKVRTSFIQTIAELAERPQHIKDLIAAGVLNLLKPLLLDSVPAIQQTAALALGRIANFSMDCAELIVSNEILPQLVYSLSEQNRFYKKSATFVLRCVSSHNEKLANAVVTSGALEPLIGCLEEFDCSVKESAAMCISVIAGHSPLLAKEVVDNGCVNLLVNCLEEPEAILKLAATQALTQITHHTEELAKKVIDGYALPSLVAHLTSTSIQVKRVTCACLTNIAKHSYPLAKEIVDLDPVTKLLECLSETDPLLCRNAASCLREIAKHSREMALKIIIDKGHDCLVSYLSRCKGQSRIPGAAALGYLAGDDKMAQLVIEAGGADILGTIINTERNTFLRGAAAWSLGQLGSKGSSHAEQLAQAGVLHILMRLYTQTNTIQDLKTKAKRALKIIIKVCENREALESLLAEATIDVLKVIVVQIRQILDKNKSQLKEFVDSGGLQRVLEIGKKAAPGTDLAKAIEDISGLYDTNIVQFLSPDYNTYLVKRIEDMR